MGKPTGFIEFERELPSDRDPLERIKDWKEFHLHLPEDRLKKQGIVVHLKTKDDVKPAIIVPTKQGSLYVLDRRDGTPPRRHALRLAGRHQAENAALAIVAVEQLRRRGIASDDTAIDRGLARATLAARIQTIATRPLTVVDAAHNVASMTALAATLRPVLTTRAPRVLVVV
jgi:folylpolyglutamate synthase/dihydropteroate synthase